MDSRITLITATVCVLAGLAFTACPSLAEEHLMIGKDARWNEPRPDLPDLSVQFISRSPRFPGLQPVYTDIKDDVEGVGPAGPERLKNPDDQRWPHAGQEVVFTTVIRNTGSQPVTAFDWAWLYDGRDVRQGRHEQPLPPNATITFEFKRPWQDGKHFVAFQVDRDRLVEEICEENNWVIDRTDALSFAFFAEESVAEFFQTVRNGLGSYSFEDWAQLQVRQMNKEFRDTIYPSCPEGIIERVRLDRVFRIPDGWGHKGGMHTPNVVMPVDFDDPEFADANNPPETQTTENFNNTNGGVDGVWGFTVDLLAKRKEWDGKNFYQFSHRWLTGSEWPLHHELGHQLGRADHYLMPTARDANAAVPGVWYVPPADYTRGMMYSGNYAHDDAIGRNKGKWDSTYRFFSEHTARSFNRDKGVRRGLFGEYFHDVPHRNTFHLHGPDGQPLSGAKVELFIAKGRGYTNPGFNAEPNFTGRAEADGSYTLDRIPWKHVFIWGNNGVIMFRVTPKDGEPLLGFLDLSHFNLAYWRGHDTAAEYTVSLKPIPPDGGQFSWP